MFLNTLVATSGFAALSAAHVLLSEPKPFAVPALQNGPIAADGSNFPCQSQGSYQTGGVSNVMALGSRQPLAFVGTAVHGGGSCQISITYDTAPTKNSVWKVIHSIEGGCPARNTPGNLGNDPNLKVPFDYSFPLPTDIPAGNATIAWTWLNKIGNREFYMNCAPATLTGAGGPKSNYDALPDMLVANIGNGCTTQEGKDYKYPNPGKSVQSFASGELAFPVGNCGPKGPSGGNGGGGQGGGPGSNPPNPGNGGDNGGGQGGGSPSQPNPGNGGGNGGGQGGGSPSKPNPGNGGGSSPGVNPPAVSAPPAAPTRKIPGGVFITVTTPEAGPTEVPGASPSVPNPPATPEVPAAPPSSGSPPASGGFTPGAACSPEGQWNCIGGTSFQRCASGTWSAVMAVAGGTTCKSGTASTLEMSTVGKKARRVALPFRG